MNMAIEIRLKVGTSGLQQKCFSEDFRLLRTHIVGCFQSVRLQNSYFPKHALHVPLPFGLRVTFIFPQEYQKA